MGKERMRVSENTLREIVDNLSITPDAEELIHHLKQMGWRLALISSGFFIFIYAVKNRLDLDYSIGNTLKIEDGIATGEVVGEIIDGQKKLEIIRYLSDQLGISLEEIDTVGDGSNDRFMPEHSGLGIGFNSKEIASEVADRRISHDDAYTTLLMLGLSDT